MTSSLLLSDQEINLLSASAEDPHIIRSYAEQISTKESFRLDTAVDPTTGRMNILSASAVDQRAAVDISWLPAASEAYNISADIKDYVIAEVPIIEGDVPNRNMHCFLTSRLVEFSPKFGCQVYKTFVGKPAFQEHIHDDNLKAKGVILDASMRNVNGRWFVMILKAFDRTKDRVLAEGVLSGKNKGHSMSAYASWFDCSVCGHRWDTSYASACEHAKGPIQARVHGKYLGAGQVYNGALMYMVPYIWHHFESSAVQDPAAWIAQQLSQNAV